jgi:hypothetical protein
VTMMTVTVTAMWRRRRRMTMVRMWRSDRR